MRPISPADRALLALIQRLHAPCPAGCIPAPQYTRAEKLVRKGLLTWTPMGGYNLTEVGTAELRGEAAAP